MVCFFEGAKLGGFKATFLKTFKGMARLSLVFFGLFFGAGGRGGSSVAFLVHSSFLLG